MACFTFRAWDLRVGSGASVSGWWCKRWIWSLVVCKAFKGKAKGMCNSRVRATDALYVLKSGGMTATELPDLRTSVASVHCAEGGSGQPTMSNNSTKTGGTGPRHIFDILQNSSTNSTQRESGKTALRSSYMKQKKNTQIGVLWWEVTRGDKFLWCARLLHVTYH